MGNPHVHSSAQRLKAICVFRLTLLDQAQRIAEGRLLDVHANTWRYNQLIAQQRAIIVERRNTIPILSNVLIEASLDGSLRLMATDLDLQVDLPLLGPLITGVVNGLVDTLLVVLEPALRPVLTAIGDILDGLLQVCRKRRKTLRRLRRFLLNFLSSRVANASICLLM